METIYDKIRKTKVIPVVKLECAEEAVRLAETLIRGGLPVIEITFRTNGAGQAIKNISKSIPEMLIGAGTVLTKDQVDLAVSCGADFIVSPGLNPTIVQYCQDINIPIVPGVATATEVELALSYGLKVVKFFPAEINGGIGALKAFFGPYSDVEFMPTGGISPDNVIDYLSLDNVIACGGTWMVDSKLLNEKDYDKIEKLAREISILIKNKF